MAFETHTDTGTMGARVFFSLGALMMAAGVGMAALAAHAGAGPELGTAATLLLANAPMIAAGGIAEALRFLRPGVGVIGLALALAGASLFAADMTHRGFGQGALFPDAAPIAGSLDILGWLTVAIACAIAHR